jgi:hypothetical protein
MFSVSVISIAQGISILALIEKSYLGLVTHNKFNHVLIKFIILSDKLNFFNIESISSFLGNAETGIIILKGISHLE